MAHTTQKSECGLIVHRKGCTCDGWSRHPHNYVPGYGPPKEMLDKVSTYLYLECLDHDPVISSYWIGEVGQHLSDVESVRVHIAGRDQLVAIYSRGDVEFQDTWTRTAAVFLSQHPKCRIGIRDEYGHAHPNCPPEAKTDATQANP